MTIILKKNSEAIRRKIKRAGIDVCRCAWFKDADWLDFNPRVTKSVHGVGYPHEGMTKEQTLAMFEHDCENPIYCKTVDEFIEKTKASMK